MKLKKVFRSSFPIIIFFFIFASVFAFLRIRDMQMSSAASLNNFNPGNIITDYVMSKYDSMSESEIQAFLDEKGNCNDTRTYLADYYSNYSYHIKNGHFVCLADETFGDGIDYGDDAPDGDSAAHIIYKAAHDYKINPQVLIVLLQKEQSLITDSWPNSRQYRSATGYGCPDTAACSEKYYGFKNQVRNAAAMFRTVLDGGWSNYTVGNNYVRYNPNSDCGGSTVYIENLATASLYRYTPYQPNSAALAAGYGAGNSCSAYGNRNFYLYFNDWFGNSTAIQKNALIIEGTYYIESVSEPNSVISLEAENTQNGNNAILKKNSSEENQKWNIVYNQKTKDFTIINSSTKTALDVEAASTSDHANVHTWETNGTCAQRWKIIELENKNLQIKSTCSGKALNSAISEEDYINIDIYKNEEKLSEQWKLKPSEEIEEGLYTISSSLKENMVISMATAPKQSKHGTNIQLSTSKSSPSERWLISKTKDGYYKIENPQSHKILDIDAANMTNSTNIQVWGSNGTCAQKWNIIKTNSNNYTFSSACSIWKVIDLAAANTTNGNNIQIYEANNSSAQKWILSPIETIQNGEYIISSALSEKKVIDIAGNSSKNGTNIQLYDKNETSAQIWKISYDETDDLYKIYNEGTGKALDAEGAGTSNKTNIHSWDQNETCAQKWSIAKNGNDYIIYSACSNLVIDVDAASTYNGTNIQLYKPNSTKAQKWHLIDKSH